MTTEQIFLSAMLLRQEQFTTPAERLLRGDLIDLSIPAFGIEGSYRVDAVAPDGALTLTRP